jgi:predicted transcriptional regulator of viral defense system
MEYSKLLKQVDELPVFSSGLLQAGNVDRAKIQKQLSRWTAAKKIYQLRRGLYTLAKPYQKKQPHLFLIANALISPSYISLQSALAYYSLIPEAVPQVLSITSRLRSQRYETPLGVFGYHHIKPQFFSGFQLEQVDSDQFAYIARPEKALLDLIYLTKQGHSQAFLETLRLQNLDQLDIVWMEETATGLGSKKIIKAVENLSTIAANELLRQL